MLTLAGCVLDVLVKDDDPRSLDMLKISKIQTLLDRKWTTYGQREFTARFRRTLCFLFIFTGSTACPAAFASRSVRRALLTSQVNPGSLYRCRRST